MLITDFINYGLTYFYGFFWIIEKSDDFLKHEGNFSYVTD